MRKTLASLAVGLLACAAFAAAAAPTLAERHVLRGLACQACHAVATPAPGAVVPTAKCNACHISLDKVAERTRAKGIDPDPHYNHLVGLNCGECHRAHGQGVYLCGGCHNLQRKVP